MCIRDRDFLYLTVNLTEVYLSDVIEAIRKLYMDKFGSLHTVFEMEPYTDLSLIHIWMGRPRKIREAAGKSSKYCIIKAVTGIEPIKRDSCGSFFHY